jgi:hypothetical protein
MVSWLAALARWGPWMPPERADLHFGIAYRSEKWPKKGQLIFGFLIIALI